MAPKNNAAGLRGTGGVEASAEPSATDSASSRGPAQRDRQPPAYQTYAADDLASAAYYTLTLAERGLYDSILRVCWVDGAVPRAVEDLALAVRRAMDEVAEHLTDRVLRHFVETLDGLLRNEELDRQRYRLNARRVAQQRGAETTNAKRDGSRDGERDGERDGKRDGKRYAPEQNRTEQKAIPEEALLEKISHVRAGARARGNGAAGVAA